MAATGLWLIALSAVKKEDWPVKSSVTFDDHFVNNSVNESRSHWRINLTWTQSSGFGLGESWEKCPRPVETEMPFCLVLRAIKLGYRPLISDTN